MFLYSCHLPLSEGNFVTSVVFCVINTEHNLFSIFSVLKTGLDTYLPKSPKIIPKPLFWQQLPNKNSKICSNYETTTTETEQENKKKVQLTTKTSTSTYKLRCKWYKICI